MPKPNKTLADYLVVSISPVLIMLLVGSLCFFLIEVFFHGAAVGSVRWVMFWFVMAVVLVSRIGLEQGTNQAMIYGLALAGASWIYLMRIHPAFILGMILLGIVWWCAHKLTWDCTLIDEDEDASGGGLLQQTVGDGKPFKQFGKKATKISGAKIERKQKPPHPPGLWVIYFSLAALPLFGIGQMLLPGDDLAARRIGFTYLFIYVTAALGLLLTTSLLGLRRYLRQRYLQMPGMIAFGWIRFGISVAALVLAGALLLPRPGAGDAWQALRYHVDYKLRQASEYAARFSPHGKGQGRPANETQNSDPAKNPTADSQPQQASGQSPSSAPDGTVKNQDASPQPSFTDQTGQFYRWFKILFLLVVAAVMVWWIFRKRDLIFQIARSFIAALKQFFKDLFQFGSRNHEPTVMTAKQKSARSPFAAYKNPFLLGEFSSWTHEQLVLYSFEAFQAWAEEQGIKPRPERTAREFCVELGGRFPEIVPELSALSFLYSHAAYGMSVPSGHNLEPVKKLWRFVCL
jgi:Domain of unknown function (DUF4129)